jgi:IS30 family transposase
MAETRGREARCGIDCTPEDIERTEAVIRAGLAKGQGIDHIYAAHRNELAFSERSFYRHVQNGTISIIPLELPRAVRYKPRKKKKGSTRTNIAPEMLAGRTYSDFMALHEDERARVVQCDCVEGTAEENCAFLTLHFVALHFQIALKLTVKDTAHVIECFAWLKDILKDDYARLFGILLFDRGCEFADVMAIERLASKGSCRAFYCDPMRSDQKGAAEKNHEEQRKIVPKGTSLADIGPWELACVMSHVNSQLRDSLFGKSPMEVALAVLPQTLFDELGYRLVAPDDVVLLPRLLDEARCPSS